MKLPLLIDANGFRIATADLSASEVGVLMWLAFHYWDFDGLPERLDVLARIGKVPEATMKRFWPRLAPFFAPGGLFPILREAATAKAERRARAGRIGGSRRWSGAHARMAS